MQQLEANSWARQMKAYLDSGEVSPSVAKNILSVSPCEVHLGNHCLTNMFRK